jgi:hypothetical protein
VWVDSALGVMARSEGAWDTASRTLTYVTRAEHSGKTLHYREVFQTLPDGARVYKNLVETPQGEFEMITSICRRRT